jgi:hypothetical protein
MPGVCSPAAVWFLQETVVATVAFTNRESLELFAKLGLHVLPHWLGIRQGAQAGRAAAELCGAAATELRQGGSDHDRMLVQGGGRGIQMLR